MNRQLRTQLAALCLLAPAAITFTALPRSAVAQPATPEVTALAVSNDHGLNPGSHLGFTVRGTPDAQASVQLGGAHGPIALRETAPGVYTGEYVVRRDDAIDPGEQLHATLRRDNRTVTADYLFPPELRAVAATRPATGIRHFQATAAGGMQPGTDVHFAVDAAPGGVAFVRLPGAPGQLHLREVRPGHYVGDYRIGANDRIDARAPVVATVRSGDQVTTASLEHPLVITTHPAPAVADVMPHDGEVVTGHDAVVSGRFEDAGGPGVDPASVQIMISGRDVTPESRVDPGSFTFRGPLAPGRHTVDVIARDTDGNAVHRTWSFDVAAAPAQVPIEILNHTNNAQVDGNVATVRGRTAPYATVDVHVDAVPPAVPGTAWVAVPVFARTLQADAAGNFDFTFASPAAVPGTRYDIQMVARQADVSNEARLTLYQRFG